MNGSSNKILIIWFKRVCLISIIALCLGVLWGVRGLIIRMGYVLYARAVPLLDPQAGVECFETINAMGIRYSSMGVSAKDMEQGCFVAQGVMPFLDSTLYAKKGGTTNYSFFVTCKMAKELIDFERDTVQALAQKYFGKPVIKIQTLGSYSCRSARGMSSYPSDHSYGYAIDIAEFILADGTIVPISDYTNSQSRGYAFLREFAQLACARFGTILTPEYDSNHTDHFHISSGPFGRCT